MAAVARQIFVTHAEHNPKPINIATKVVTKIYSSVTSHPFYWRTQRRLAAFDPTKLHLLVVTKPSGLKRALIRSHAVNRLRAQLFEALREQGFNWDGTVRSDAPDTTKYAFRGLSGAYKLSIIDTPAALNEEASELKRQCMDLVQQMKSDAAKKARKAAGDVFASSSKGRAARSSTSRATTGDTSPSI